MRRQLGAVLMTVGLGLAVAGPATAASAVPPFDGLEYVALGDSYSAGFGLPNPNPALPAPGCYQSSQNYPHQVAAALGLTLNDRTCSGAVTANIIGTPQPTINGGGIAPVQSLALSPSTDIVTVTIGGNDLNFAIVSATCVAESATGPLVVQLPNCKDIYHIEDPPLEPVDTLVNLLNNTVVPALNATFLDIRTKAPNAKIFVVGYPAISPDAANVPPGGCYSSPLGTGPGGDFEPPFPENSFPFETTDAEYLHHIESLLDDAIQTAAQQHDATFIPTWDATAAHTACAGSEAYIYGITLTTDANNGHPKIPGLDLWLQLGALHPNPAGASFITSQVLDAIKGHPAFGAEATAKPQIAATGVNGAPLAAAGLGIALVGFVLVAARRRRVS